MTKRKTLFDIVAVGADDTTLDRLAVGVNEVDVIPFTSTIEEVELHFAPDADLNCYFHCIARGCYACAAGLAKTPKVLIPVYSNGRVQVMALSPDKSPGALLPQLTREIKEAGDRKVVIFMRQTDTRSYKFDVTSELLPDGVDDGAAKISAFMKKYDAGEIALASVYRTLDNASLANVPSIARKLELKGIKVEPAA